MSIPDLGYKMRSTFITSLYRQVAVKVSLPSTRPPFPFLAASSRGMGSPFTESALLL